MEYNLPERLRISHKRGMSEENEQTILVRIHGLLGEPEGTLMELDVENLEGNSQFGHDNVVYQVTRTILEDVEHPIVYVMVLDIYMQEFE